MHTPTVFGVDPGLVHTGVVMFDFLPADRQLVVKSKAIDGLDPFATRLAMQHMSDHKALSICDIFIEWYRPRSGFNTDERMVQANASFKQELGGTLVKNSGVKKIVSRQLLELVHAYKFGAVTHHQDLRSAARIALLGMMLDPALNRVLYDYAVDQVDGREWHVRVDT